jgi:hypothetical protein
MSDEDCQKQTRSSTPDQTNKMINVFRNVIPIAILTINGRRSGDRFLNDCCKDESFIISRSACLINHLQDSVPQRAMLKRTSSRITA